MLSREIADAAIVVGQAYGYGKIVEPFCGGCSVTQRLAKFFSEVYASDAHPQLIAAWQKMQTGWVPPEINEEDYGNIKKNRDEYPDYVAGYYGFLGWGGRYFGSYPHVPEDYNDVYRRSVIDKAKNLSKVVYVCRSYDDIEDSELRNSVVYCDPPYLGTAGYDGVDEFDHDKFWKWVLRIAEFSPVLVSEYSCPVESDLWFSIEKKITITVRNTRHAVENLYYFGPEPIGDVRLRLF